MECTDGALIPVPLIDHNGDWGFSGEAGQVVATVDADSLTLHLGPSRSIELTRID